MVLGAGIYYSVSEYAKLKQENDQLKKQVIVVSPSPATLQPTEAALVSPQAEGTPATGSAMATGKIQGTVGYPSEVIPPLAIYAISATDKSVFVSVENPANTASFTIPNVKAGSYYVVAYPVANPSMAGAYSKAVPCGLLASCTDHSMIAVEVNANKTVTGVEVKDWYAPEGTFPAKPE